MSSELKTNKISPATGTTTTLGDSGDTFDIPSGATLDVTGATVTGLSAGKVLQVVQTVKSDTASTTGTSFAAISGLSATITPSSSSNKILVMSSNYANGGNGDYLIFQLQRGSTAIFVGDAASSRARGTGPTPSGGAGFGTRGIEPYVFNYLDSPSTTSATTYSVNWKVGSGTAYLNRGETDDDNANHSRTASSIILMEIAA